MIALDFDGSERQLSEIIKDYGLVLDDSIIGKLKEACWIASDGKHQVAFTDHDGPVVDPRGREMADGFYKLLSDAAEIARRIFREKTGFDQKAEECHRRELAARLVACFGFIDRSSHCDSRNLRRPDTPGSIPPKHLAEPLCLPKQRAYHPPDIRW